MINRVAEIRIWSHIRPPIPLEAGVPQGSAISPTLNSVSTNDIPLSATDYTTIQYADDITQIISYSGKSRALTTNRIEKEIKNINEYEKKWKIKTYNNKFKIKHIVVKKKTDIIIDNTQINYSEKEKVLGLTITRTGITQHVSEIKIKD